MQMMLVADLCNEVCWGNPVLKVGLLLFIRNLIIRSNIGKNKYSNYSDLFEWQFTAVSVCEV